MRINHNIAALNTFNKLSANQSSTQGSLEKLSSGLKINKAGDDAAGLAISEKMRGQIRGLDMASKNAQDGISLIQTAEGALNETHSILQRMRELSVQSASDSNNDNDRAELQKEVDQLASEITRISTDTEFNTKKLINGDAKDLTFHIGANAGQSISLAINDMGAEALKVDGGEVSDDGTTITVGEDVYTFQEAEEAVAADPDAVPPVEAKAATVAGYYSEADGDGNKTLFKAADKELAAGTTLGINISDKKSADTAITTIQTAIDTVSAERSKLGAYQNRLDHTINNLGTSSENLTAAESRIRDVNMAQEMMNFTKNNILSQAAQSMLAQANQQPQGVLQLLQ
ncbi:flagellin [Terribacillus saccharophilus]|uniref:Flagellin n=1 Tax=Terribacillus saccharophilus TaxID=361277 RepID=A0AAX2EF36_9BACI|nr:flagellin [Terribacillus saccharophilus]